MCESKSKIWKEHGKTECARAVAESKSASGAEAEAESEGEASATIGGTELRAGEKDEANAKTT